MSFLLILIGTIGMMWRITSWIHEIKSALHGLSSIEKKLIFVTSPILDYKIDPHEIYSFFVRFMIYNYSNQPIRCSVDHEKTSLIINGKTEHKFKYFGASRLIMPYDPRYEFKTHDIPLEIKEGESLTTRVTVTIFLRYGHQNDKTEAYSLVHNIDQFVKLTRLNDGKIKIDQLSPAPSTTPPASARD